MKTALIFLFILTSAIRPTKEQSEGDSSIDTTSCGTRADMCWTAQKEAILQADAVFDVIAGCKLFKLYATCFDAVFKDPTCTDDPTVLLVNAMAIADRNGLCLGDGSVSKCGSDTQQCFNIVKTIKNAVWTGHETDACPVIANLTHCAAQIKISPTCNGNIKVMLDDLEADLYQGSLFEGCDGNCGIKVGSCLENLTSVMLNGDFINIDWKKYCVDAYAGYGCVINLKTDSACLNDQMVSQMSDPNQMGLSNFCVGDGKPSPCIQQIKDCTAAWKAADKNSLQECRAATAYLTCTNGVSCASQVPDLLYTLRNNIESIETKDKCPLVGTCSDRLAVCNNKEAEVNDTRASNQIQYCVAVKTAVACFNNFRQDTYCAGENIATTKFETSISRNVDISCGATVDACGAKVAVCNALEANVNTTRDSKQDQYCATVKAAEDCFNNFRQDTNCSQIIIPETDFETSVARKAGPSCGGCQERLFISVFLLAISLLFSFTRLF